MWGASRAREVGAKSTWAGLSRERGFPLADAAGELPGGIFGCWWM